jgi:predicted NBD/HSP70 family sugar kinase
VFALVDRLVAATDRPILGVGIGTAGLIDTTDGTVLQAVNLDWRNVPLGALLRRRTRLPVYVANDSQSIALAEHLFGGRRTANLVVVKVGQGIGAGVVLDGHLFQGDGFGAGEIGHTTVRSNGELCRCGRLGCLETVSSSRAILERLEHEAPGRFTSLDAAVSSYHAGDPAVGAVVVDAARELGLALAWLVGALNVERVVLVGTVTEFGAGWLNVVADTMRASALPLLVEGTSVEIGGLPADAVVLGASALLATRELGLNLAGLARRPALTVVAPEAVA